MHLPLEGMCQPTERGYAQEEQWIQDHGTFVGEARLCKYSGHDVPLANHPNNMILAGKTKGMVKGEKHTRFVTLRYGCNADA